MSTVRIPTRRPSNERLSLQVPFCRRSSTSVPIVNGHLPLPAGRKDHVGAVVAQDPRLDRGIRDACAGARVREDDDRPEMHSMDCCEHRAANGHDRSRPSAESHDAERLAATISSIPRVSSFHIWSYNRAAESGSTP